MSRQGGGYRVGWTVVTGACLAMGAAITVLVDTVGALVLMAIMATAAAFLLAIVLKQADRPGRYVLRSTPVLMLVLTGVNGLAVALGPVTFALVAVLVITGIPVAWQLRNGPAPAPDPKPAKAPKPPKTVIRAPVVPEPAAAPASSSEVLDLPDSTASLCWTWRTSFSALHKAGGLDERLRIVELRQYCLDELARREPAGFRKWLEAGARAAGDPTRYVCVHPKTAAKDEPDAD